ncbi:hypothetical protein TI39_contig348g00014 [Zymoseptoria brevis]|uniref:Uncharacterized protein n=1 Tax=Zymoseptoria brevis TaxID=1047168 RepID=A0A0F4GRP4_9PEZI|nr:hypothetical protein TI39_contig348g00014 [Zymoseptoria brevis]
MFVCCSCGTCTTSSSTCNRCSHSECSSCSHMGRPALPSHMPAFPWLADEFAETKTYLPDTRSMIAGIDQTVPWVAHNRYTRWVQAGKPELEGWSDDGWEGKEKGYEGDDEKGLG